MVLHPDAIRALEELIAAEPGLSQRDIVRRLQAEGHTISQSSVDRILKDSAERRKRRKRAPSASRRASAAVKCPDCGRRVYLLNGNCAICRVLRFRGYGPDSNF